MCVFIFKKISYFITKFFSQYTNEYNFHWKIDKIKDEENL